MSGVPQASRIKDSLSKPSIAASASVPLGLAAAGVTGYQMGKRKGIKNVRAQEAKKAAEEGIKKQKEKNNLETNFNLVIRLPINIVEFNRAIVNLSQKHKFDQNSLIKIKNYILDKNERVLKQNDTRLKVTEKEIYFIENLLASKKPLSKNFILENIWKYSSETDTHTVETHIYRLRQKIKNHFNDDNFIKYTGKGYSL